MQPISDADIRIRIQRDNPWWAQPNLPSPEAEFPRRVYFQPLRALALDWSVHRATVLLGARRVGKTVMIKQLVAEAIAAGTDPNESCTSASIHLYIPEYLLSNSWNLCLVDHPVHSGL